MQSAAIFNGPSGLVPCRLPAILLRRFPAAALNKSALLR